MDQTLVTLALSTDSYDRLTDEAVILLLTVFLLLAARLTVNKSIMWVSPRVGSWVVKASNFNTGTKPKYPTRTRIILNFSIFLSNFNTGGFPSIRQGLLYPEFFLPHSVGAPHDPHYR